MNPIDEAINSEYSAFSTTLPFERSQMIAFKCPLCYEQIVNRQSFHGVCSNTRCTKVICSACCFKVMNASSSATPMCAYCRIGVLRVLPVSSPSISSKATRNSLEREEGSFVETHYFFNNLKGSLRETDFSKLTKAIIEDHHVQQNIVEKPNAFTLLGRKRKEKRMRMAIQTNGFTINQAWRNQAWKKCSIKTQREQTVEVSAEALREPTFHQAMIDLIDPETKLVILTNEADCMDHVVPRVVMQNMHGKTVKCLCAKCLKD